MQRTFTIGIEEEFQLVDSATLGLQSHVSQMLKAGRQTLGDQIKPEILQSVVEVGTKVCTDIEQAADQVHMLRATLSQLAAQHGFHIAAAGAHPWSDWRDQEITEHDRYRSLVQDLQDVVRALTIFGLHVHIGIDDRQRAIEIMNEARYFLPHLLALSANSPFWRGRQTGLHSYRCVVWNRFPRTGIPDAFGSWDDFENLVETMVRTGCIDDAKRIWWDIRPHPYFNTLEFRICDMQTRAEETLTLAALMQAIVAKLYRLRERNLGFRQYHRSLLMENRWRAMRHGLEGRLIDFGKEAEVPITDLLKELLDFVDEVVDDLGSRRYVEYVHTMIANGNGAQRQLAVFARTGDLRAVEENIIKETEVEVPASPRWMLEAQELLRELEPVFGSVPA
ncbi:MAG TPA: carboxylate-amine ligase [Chloroflexota bacterium]|nr:carboxylate-amine ligase [Chloroflexota bacterium]